MTVPGETDSLGWRYVGDPKPNSDSRHLVSLSQDGMEWVGIRAWHSQQRLWFNGNDPEGAQVIAWMPLPATARRHWSRGILVDEVIQP